MTPDQQTFTRCSRQLAADSTRRLMGCYRRGDCEDPEIYAASVASVLLAYPEQVVLAVVNPVSGIPSKTKWLPAVAEVKEACEAEMNPIYAKLRRERQAEERRRLLAPPEISLEERQRVTALWEKVVRPELQPPSPAAETPAQAAAKLKAMVGMTDEQWDAIPDQPAGSWSPLGTVTRGAV